MASRAREFCLGSDIVHGETDVAFHATSSLPGGWRYSKPDPHRYFLARRITG